MNRRQFLRSTATTTVFASQTGRLWALDADNAYRRNLGLQLYTLRNEIGKDVTGTMKAVADAGYQQGEPYGFPNCDPLIKAMREAGLALNSTHFEWDSVVNPKDAGMSEFVRIVEKAKREGLSHLVIPYLQAEVRQTLDDYKKLAAHFNRAAVLARDAGIQLSYHNHAFEFEPKEGGKTGYDVFMAEFGEALGFEVDVFWVKVGGVEPAALIKKLKGRVSQLHLKDLKAGMHLPEYGGVPNDAFQALGAGIIPMEPILLAAKDAGVVHCHVEQDQSSDPIADIRRSMAYLRGL
jgi:sugar phosphate isomerase/epimerase